MASTRHEFDQELAQLKQQLLDMGAMASAMVTGSVAALRDSDVAWAESIIARDAAVDALERDVDARCIRLLATQQPNASDLRLIAVGLKVVTDLERIADHAVGIARITRALQEELSLAAPLLDIDPLADPVQHMLDESLDTLLRQDSALAERIIAEDDTVDAAYRVLRGELFALSQRDSGLTPAVSYTLLIASYLERIADHAVNIAERVYFLKEGAPRPS